ncbi:MAG TPA: TIGR02391 family protein [Cyclobacteriaceae bacterium]|nr:TIGR02391 family protein [Cyclobacteriaceae bacterium]
MLYNIYQVDFLGGTSALVAMKIAVVRKLAEAFVRGQDEIRHEGTTYSIKSVVFKIFEVPVQLGTDTERIEGYSDDYMSQYCHGNLYERVFNDNCKNVTSEFLLGRERGDIQDYFNLYVNDGDKKTILTVLTRDQVIEFEAAFAQGQKPIWLDNRSVVLSSPKRVKVFNISLDYLSKEKGVVKAQMTQWVNLVRSGKWDNAVLEHFGKEVTDQFNFRAFGSLSGVNLNDYSRFDWREIHPEISRHAKPRFKDSHYADAVESALKELNDIVKKAYKKSTNKEEDGASLMRKAFSHTNPVFVLADINTESGRNVQEGYMNLFAGVIIGIRNPKAHANIEITDQDAWEKITLASHLLKIWDKRLNKSQLLGQSS